MLLTWQMCIVVFLDARRCASSCIHGKWNGISSWCSRWQCRYVGYCWSESARKHRLFKKTTDSQPESGRWLTLRISSSWVIREQQIDKYRVITKWLSYDAFVECHYMLRFVVDLICRWLCLVLEMAHVDWRQPSVTILCPYHHFYEGNQVGCTSQDLTLLNCSLGSRRTMWTCLQLNSY